MSYSLRSRSTETIQSNLGRPKKVWEAVTKKHKIISWGLLEPHYSFTKVLSTEEATVLSSTLDHQYFERAHGEDKYFTMQEYLRMKEEIADISAQFAQKGEEVSGDMPRG